MVDGAFDRTGSSWINAPGTMMRTRYGHGDKPLLWTDVKKRALGIAKDSGWDTDDDREGPGYPGKPRSCGGYRTHCPTPAMLLACREPHNIASKVVSTVLVRAISLFSSCFFIRFLSESYPCSAPNFLLCWAIC